jgi:hypothetical protein
MKIKHQSNTYIPSGDSNLSTINSPQTPVSTIQDEGQIKSSFESAVAQPKEQNQIKPQDTKQSQSIPSKLEENLKQQEAQQQKEEISNQEAQQQKEDESLKLMMSLMYGGDDSNFSGSFFNNLFGLLQQVTSEQPDIITDEVINMSEGLKQLDKAENTYEKCKELSKKWKLDGNLIIYSNQNKPTETEKRFIEVNCKKPNLFYYINEYLFKLLFIDLKNMAKAIYISIHIPSTIECCEPPIKYKYHPTEYKKKKQSVLFSQ